MGKGKPFLPGGILFPFTQSTRMIFNTFPLSILIAEVSGLRPGNVIAAKQRSERVGKMGRISLAQIGRLRYLPPVLWQEEK